MLSPERYQQLILTEAVITEAGLQQGGMRGWSRGHCTGRCFWHCSHGGLRQNPLRIPEAWGYRHVWGTSQEWLPDGHPMLTFMLRSNVIKC